MKLRSWLLSTWALVVGAFVSTRTKKAPQTALAAELPGEGWATTRTGAAGPDLDGEAAFADWLDKALRAAPNQAAYGQTYLDSAAAVVRWRRRYRGNPKLWNRLMKDKVVKELIECAPVVAACRDYVDAHTKPVTVVDLCSGKGYLAMLLSEMLPKDKVARIVLVDKAWPLNGQDEPLPHQINWDHIYDYYEDWPITLTTSKQNLKCKSSVRGMKRRVLDEAPGDIVVLAVHLCGTLSLKALDLFNSHEKCSFLVLKPCCLPGLVHSKRDEVFVVGDHSFDSKEVCSNGRFKGNVWKGPPRHLIRGKFERWARNLERGAKLRGDGVRRLENITVETCVEINQCFFTKSYLGDDAAEHGGTGIATPSSRHRVDGVENAAPSNFDLHTGTNRGRFPERVHLRRARRADGAALGRPRAARTDACITTFAFYASSFLAAAAPRRRALFLPRACAACPR